VFVVPKPQPPAAASGVSILPDVPQPEPVRVSPVSTSGYGRPPASSPSYANVPRPSGFSWWWPSTPWAHWALLIWLVISGLASTVVAGPVGGFVNSAIWYLMIIAVRFVFIQAKRAKA
jgi:hypothetical protein